MTDTVQWDIGAAGAVVQGWPLASAEVQAKPRRHGFRYIDV